MAKQFMYSDSEINVLKNFATINPSMVMGASSFQVINNAKSVIGLYPFEEPYQYDAFGVYETNEFLTAVNAMKDPTITVEEKFLSITDGEATLKYFTTAKDLLPVVPDVETKFKQVTCDLVFTLSADKFAFLMKMANILKTKYLFFETEGDKIKLTVGDELCSSSNNYEVLISEGITTNQLSEPVKVVLSEFKIIQGAYEVSVSSRISKWDSVSGITYYVGCAA